MVIPCEDIPAYQELAEHGGSYPEEAYFHFCCHKYLPDDIDRILYIDAGDVIIHGNIDEYYFADFEDKSLIVSPEAVKDFDGKEITCFGRKDMESLDSLRVIACLVVNSGSFIINLEKYRTGYTMDDYLNRASRLKQLDLFASCSYLTDQGLLGAAFVGDMVFFESEKVKTHICIPFEPMGSKCFEYASNPYNFLTHLLIPLNEAPCIPIIIHFLFDPLSMARKPFEARFPNASFERLDFDVAEDFFTYMEFYQNFAPFGAKRQVSEINEIWWDYCKMTPVYHELNLYASAHADALDKHYLPLCKRYNSLKLRSMELPNSKIEKFLLGVQMHDEKTNEKRYEMIVFYGCGRYLKWIFSDYKLSFLPDEIWDMDADSINDGDLSFLGGAERNVPIKKPDFNISADKNKIAIVLTLADIAVKNKVRQMLHDYGFTSVFEFCRDRYIIIPHAKQHK